MQCRFVFDPEGEYASKLGLPAAETREELIFAAEDGFCIFDPHALWYLFEKKGWPDWLRDVRRRCRCTGCGAREPALDLVHEEPTGERLKMPSEQEWKRMRARRR